MPLRAAQDGASKPQREPYTLAAARQSRARGRRARAGNARRWPLKHPCFECIKERLLDQHSLSQALGRVHREQAALMGPPVPWALWPSRATLYRRADALGWIDQKRYPSIRLRHYYARHERKARAERAPNAWVKRCPSVEQRPAELFNRSQPLCMEIDTVVGRKSDSARLVVAVCRQTRFTMIGLLKHCSAQAVQQWVRTRMRQAHVRFRCLIPDQGSEFARLPEIKSLTVYPCQPHRPWQKPTVENTNGLIRHYVPKGHPISSLTPEFVAYVEHQLNHRPRKCLDWETPYELLSRLLPAGAL